MKLRAYSLALPLLGLTATLGLSACNKPPESLPGLREANAADVGQCRYLTDIRMEPGVYGPVLGDSAVTRAYGRVRQDALAAGANTVVFDQVTPGTPVYVVHAKAYHC